MKLEPLRRFIVGIDPGQSTGFSIFDREKERLVISGTSDFHAVQDFLVKTFPTDELRGEVKVYVEKPKSMLYKRNESTIRNEELKIMFHCGGNVRESSLISEALRLKGFEVEQVDPVHEAKWDQRRWTLFTGSNKRTSEHERDATRLAVVNANKRKFV